MGQIQPQQQHPAAMAGGRAVEHGRPLPPDVRDEHGDVQHMFQPRPPILQALMAKREQHIAWRQHLSFIAFHPDGLTPLPQDIKVGRITRERRHDTRVEIDMKDRPPPRKRVLPIKKLPRPLSHPAFHLGSSTGTLQPPATPGRRVARRAG